MRDLLILAIVVGTLPFALRHTWVAVMLWTWVSIMNPHRLAFGFIHDAPVAAIAAGAALLSMMISRDKLRMPWSPAVVVLLLFVGWMCLTTVLAIDPVSSWGQLSKILKIQLMTVIALMALHERKHIDVFIWVLVISIGFFGFKGGIFTILQGGAGTVWGPPGGFIEDNNALAVAVVMTIPLMNYLRMVSTRRSVRWGLLALMLLCAFSVLGSQSRGALLAISAMGMVLWYRSDRKVLAGVAIVALAISLLAFMPESWTQRMETISEHEQDRSASTRLLAWQTAINLANHRLPGGGFEIYQRSITVIYAPPELLGAPAAHSIYFSVLGEHGYVGLFLFLTLWWLAFRLGGSIRKQTSNQAELAWLHHLAGMCQVTLVGYLVGGAFLSLAYFDLPYDILVVLVVSQRWLKDRASKDSASGAPASDALAKSPATADTTLPRALT